MGTALVLAFLIKTFFLQAFYIPSGSMRPELQVSDRILVQKVSYWFGAVDRGDVVVFDDPGGWLGPDLSEGASNPVTRTLETIGLYPSGGHIVKRVIGVAGDEVACADGALSVNQSVLAEGTYVTLADSSCTGKWRVDVPEDRLWVMGDNRANSVDSRAHLGSPGGGFIPVDDVVGRVFVVAWPPKHWAAVTRPSAFAGDSLDQAAGLVLPGASLGLAWTVVPLARRWSSRSRGRHREEDLRDE